MKKVELERRVKELEAQNQRLVSQFKTGRFSHGGKFYRGIPLDVEVEAIVMDRLRDLMCEQYQGGEGGYEILEDGYHARELVLPGVSLYIVRFSYSQADGTWVEAAWRAIEVQ